MQMMHGIQGVPVLSRIHHYPLARAVDPPDSHQNDGRFALLLPQSQIVVAE